MMQAALFIAMVSFWLSGCWWDSERKASTYALLFAFLILAIGWGSR